MRPAWNMMAYARHLDRRRGLIFTGPRLSRQTPGAAKDGDRGAVYARRAEASRRGQYGTPAASRSAREHQSLIHATIRTAGADPFWIDTMRGRILG